jgi:RNA processing factor Prp31
LKECNEGYIYFSKKSMSTAQLTMLMESIKISTIKCQNLIDEIALVDIAIADVSNVTENKHTTIPDSLSESPLRNIMSGSFSDSLADAIEKSDQYHRSLETIQKSLEQKRGSLLCQLITTKESIKDSSRTIKDIRSKSFSEVSTIINRADSIVETVTIIESRFTWSDCDDVVL